MSSTPIYGKHINGLSRLDYHPFETVSIEYDREELYDQLLDHIETLFGDEIVLEYSYLGQKMTHDILLQRLSIDVNPYDDPFFKTDFAFVYSLKIKNVPYVWIESPLYFSPKSLNTLALCKKNLRIQDYLDDFIGRKTLIERSKFMQYLQNVKQLDYRTNKKDEPNYWKNDENVKHVIEALTEISISYNRPSEYDRR